MMWKLVDCGTYPWFVRETKKYFYCVYSLTGETKKLVQHLADLTKKLQSFI